MKRLIFLSLTVLSIVMFSSCNGKEKDTGSLQQSVEAYFQQCPRQSGFFVVNCVQYDQETNNVFCLFSPKDVYVTSEKNMGDVVRQSILLHLNDSVSRTAELKSLADAGAGITFRIKCGDNFANGAITPAELKDLLNKVIPQDEADKLSYQNIVTYENAKCPNYSEILDNGILKEVKDDVDTNSLLYEFEFDEQASGINLSLMKRNYAFQKMIKDLIFEAGDYDMFDELVNMNKGLVYRLKGEPSGERLDIVLTPDELADGMNFE